MEAREIIEFIGNAEKKTPVKVYVREKAPVDFEGCQVFGSGDKIVFGDWSQISGILEKNADSIEDYVIENDCRNSAVPLLDMKNIKARIEPGAVIRDKVDIGDNAVIMMGADHQYRSSDRRRQHDRYGCGPRWKSDGREKLSYRCGHGARGRYRAA